MATIEDAYALLAAYDDANQAFTAARIDHGPGSTQVDSTYAARQAARDALVTAAWHGLHALELS
jgi:hypothetical protein